MTLTPLWSLALELWYLGAEWAKLSVRVGTVLILGQYLSVPFQVVSSIFFRTAAAAWDADSLITDMRNWVVWIRYQGGLNDLIRSLFGAWDHLRNDPYGWIDDIISGLMGSWRDLRHNPNAWVNDRISSWFGDWNSFRWDPTGFLRDQIEIRLGLGSGFFADPVSWLRNKLIYRLGVDRDFFDDPVGWLRGELIYRLGVDRDFFDDPDAWIWNRFRDAVDRYLDSHTDWLVNTVSRVLNDLWTMKT